MMNTHINTNIIEGLEVERVIETDEATYDLTFIDGDNDGNIAPDGIIMVFAFDSEETILFDIIHKKEYANCTYEESFYKNISSYIIDYFGIEVLGEVRTVEVDGETYTLLFGTEYDENDNEVMAIYTVEEYTNNMEFLDIAYCECTPENATTWANNTFAEFYLAA